LRAKYCHRRRLILFFKFIVGEAFQISNAPYVGLVLINKLCLIFFSLIFFVAHISHGNTKKIVRLSFEYASHSDSMHLIESKKIPRLMNQVRRAQSTAALVFLALIWSIDIISEVSAWSPQTKATTPSFSSLPSSYSSIDSAEGNGSLSTVSRRTIFSTAAYSLVLGGSVLVGNPALTDAAEEASFVYTRKQTVLNKKELNYQISIPSTMKEGSKPVKTHLDEVNFMSESVKRYQYGITVDPVRISSLKEVCSYL